MVRKTLPWLLALSACASIAAAGSPHSALQFNLRDTAGATHTQAEWAHSRAIVIFFVTTDCPLSNAYAPEMSRIADSYGPRGVRVYAVQGDTSIPDEEVRHHAKEYGYRFPALFDPQQILAHASGATITPQAAVLSPEGNVLYLGRIDNRVQDFGKVRYQPTEFDLRDALDEILAGRPVAHPRTHAIGCSIPFVH